MTEPRAYPTLELYSRPPGLLTLLMWQPCHERGVDFFREGAQATSITYEEKP